MTFGDLYLADVPFANRDGGKVRVVMILKVLSDADVLVLESRGKPHPNRKLIGIVDFTRRGYLGKGYGQSHFYREHLSVINSSSLKRRIAALIPEDKKIFFEGVKSILEPHKGE